MNSHLAQNPFIQRVSSVTFFFLSVGTRIAVATCAFFVIGLTATVFGASPALVTLLVLVATLVGFVGSVVCMRRARGSHRRTIEEAAYLQPAAQASRRTVAARVNQSRQTYEASFDDEQEDGQSQPDDEVPRKFRMVDWKQTAYLSFWAPVLLLVGSSFALYYVPILSGIMIVAAPISVPVLLFVHLSGYVFDAAHDRLSYPMYVFRRTTILSQIDDANCQTTFQRIRTDPGDFGGGRGRVKERTVRRYIANLSGDFGARRVVFFSKHKRDQFLSLLRRYAPQARITRWS